MSLLSRPHCSSCIYYVADTQPSTGHCHRHPPGVYASAGSGMGSQKFPTVDHHSWCGEWSDDQAHLADLVRRSMRVAAERRG